MAMLIKTTATKNSIQPLASPSISLWASTSTRGAAQSIKITSQLSCVVSRYEHTRKVLHDGGVSLRRAQAGHETKLEWGGILEQSVIVCVPKAFLIM